MATLLAILYWETLILLVGFMGVVAMGLLSGRINANGLLSGKGRSDAGVSPERVQLLLFTVAAAFQYVSAAVKNPNEFPAVSTAWIALLGGSHVIYLGGKFTAAFFGKGRNLS